MSFTLKIIRIIYILYTLFEKRKETGKNPATPYNNAFMRLSFTVTL